MTSASRMMYAFSRDGAVPGWRHLEPRQRSSGSRSTRSSPSRSFALILTLPALKGNKDGVTVAFTAVVSIGVIGLYIAYVIPICLRWRMGDEFEPGPWTLGNKYKWMCLVAVIEVLIVVVICFNLPFSSVRRAVGERLRVVAVQLHAGGDGRRVRDRRDLVAGERAPHVQGPAHARSRSSRTEKSRGLSGSIERRRSRSSSPPPRRCSPRSRARASRRPTPPSRAPRRRSRPGGRSRPPTARALLHRLADALEDEHEELAQLEARNAGKPIGDARGEMGMVVDTFRYYAGAPERLLGDTIPVAGGVGDDVPRAARRRRR